MAAADMSSEKSTGLQARKSLAKKVYTALAKAIPEPKAELKYSSVYELLTAVMLSAQATDKSVNAVTGELFRRAPTPEKMLELGEESVRAIVKTVGLANTKSRHIIEERRHRGRYPYPARSTPAGAFSIKNSVRRIKRP